MLPLTLLPLQPPPDQKYTWLSPSVLEAQTPTPKGILLWITWYLFNTWSLTPFCTCPSADTDHVLQASVEPQVLLSNSPPRTQLLPGHLPLALAPLPFQPIDEHYLLSGLQILWLPPAQPSMRTCSPDLRVLFLQPSLAGCCCWAPGFPQDRVVVMGLTVRVSPGSPNPHLP